MWPLAVGGQPAPGGQEKGSVPILGHRGQIKLAFGPAAVAGPAMAALAIGTKVAITPLAAHGPRVTGRMVALTLVALVAV